MLSGPFQHFSPRNWKCRVLKTQELTEKFEPRKEVPAELGIQKLAGEAKVQTGDRKTMEAMELYITSVCRVLVFACDPAYERLLGISVNAAVETRTDQLVHSSGDL